MWQHGWQSPMQAYLAKSIATTMSTYNSQVTAATATAATTEAIIYNKMQQQHLPQQQQLRQQQLSVRPVCWPVAVFNTLQNQNVTPATVVVVIVVVAVAVVAAAVKVKLKFTWPVQHLGQFELLALYVCASMLK